MYIIPIVLTRTVECLQEIKKYLPKKQKLEIRHQILQTWLNDDPCANSVVNTINEKRNWEVFALFANLHFKGYRSLAIIL